MDNISFRNSPKLWPSLESLTNALRDNKQHWERLRPGEVGCYFVDTNTTLHIALTQDNKLRFYLEHKVLRAPAPRLVDATMHAASSGAAEGAMEPPRRAPVSLSSQPSPHD